jgi:hypothetical protein
MLAAGTLPDGYTVRKRRLVRVGDLAASQPTDSRRPKKANKRGDRRLPDAA